MINLESDDQNIPKGLDDLLNSIRGGSKQQDSSALAVYAPDKREENLVSEQVDERILDVLGLEDVVDIDYATYKTLLREKMMEGRMANSKMPSDEVEILTDEFKRVRSNTGRFKVKKQKIKFESFTDNVRTQETSEPQKSLLALPGTAQVKTPDVGVDEEDKVQGIEKFLGGMTERLEKIEKNLSDMLDMEAKNAADEKKEVESERVSGEKTKKRKRESSLEKGIKGFGKSITSKVTKPVKGFFETLLNFFMQIFLGSAVLGLIKLLENPMMIFNPLINLVNGVIGMVNNILNFMFGGLVEPVNNLVGFLNGGITNLENTINGIFGMFAGEEGVDEEDKITLPRIKEAEVPKFKLIDEFKPKEEKPKEEPVKGMAGGGLIINEGPTFNVKQEVGGYTEGGQVTNLNLGSIGGWKGGSTTISPKVSGFEGGGEIKPTYNFLSPISNFAYAGGGSITSSSGQTITGMGPDTQLIAAQPGEIVMSKKAVQTYGANNLLAMNKDAGGTNIPTMGSIRGFSGGGIIEGAKQVIGQGKGTSNQCANTTRAALASAGHPAAEKRTQIGDLDTPQGTAYNGRALAASFGGTDMGKVITNKSQIKSGDIILWRADRDKGGAINKGAITHVGIAADDGLKNQYDHNKTNGWHYRPHWHAAAGTSWFAGIRLGESGGSVPSDVSSGVGAPEPGDDRSNMMKPSSISSPAPKSVPGPPSSKSSGSIVALPGGSQGQQPSQSSTSAGQKEVPSFSSRDMGNTEFIVIKSIYNIVG